MRQSQRRTQRRNIRRTRQPFYGHRKILKPDHLNWEEYALLLLHSMPEVTAEHYRNKIAVYLQWYKKKGMHTIPQTQHGDIGSRDIPSWRRICKVLLNNDYWCRALSFSPTKPKNYQRYNERMKAKRREWGSYATPTHNRNNSLSL